MEERDRSGFRQAGAYVRPEMNGNGWLVGGEMGSVVDGVGGGVGEREGGKLN